MQTVDATVRLQTLDGNWETCGIDRAAGITPEGIELASNSWGADTANFTLRRSPRSQWPDITAFTPVEIEIGGSLVWDGFVTQTPTSDADGGSISVQCKGWQYHLDDDSFEKVWTHSSLPDWKEASSFPNIDLNHFRPDGPSVVAGNGSIRVGWATTKVLQQNTYAAVVFDAGPLNKITAASVQWTVVGGTGFTNYGTSANLRVVCRGVDSLTAGHTVSNDAVNTPEGATNTALSGSGAFTTPSRYVIVGLYWVGGTATASTNYFVDITGINLTGWSHGTPTAHLSGTLASEIAADVLPYAPLLSQSTTSIATTDFTIPHFSSVDGGKTPREYLTAANSYHDNQLKLLPGRKLSVQAQPASPSYTVGAWGGSTFSDASANSGEEIYNKAIVESTDSSGQPLRQTRFSAASVDTLTGLAELQPSAMTNPAFETDPVFSAASKIEPTGWASSRVYSNSNLASTALTASLTTTATTMSATSPLGSFPPNGFIVVDQSSGIDEIIYYSGTTSTTFTGLIRGCFGTTARTGVTGNTVYLVSAIQPIASPAGFSAGTKSGLWRPNGESTPTLTATFNSGQNFTAGTSYELSINMRAQGMMQFGSYVLETPYLRFGTSTDYAEISSSYSLSGITTGDQVDFNLSVQWTPSVAVSGSAVTLFMQSIESFYSSYRSLQDGNFTSYYIDDVTITSIKATIPDRRGFIRTKRLQVNSPSTPESASRIADKYLSAHRSTPLKGDLTIQSGGAKEYLTGADIHPSRLLLSTGELLHFSNRTDPDTGAQGRDGTIAAVSYSHSSQSAQVSIDNQRTRFEAFLERLAVNTNNRLGR